MTSCTVNENPVLRGAKYLQLPLPSVGTGGAWPLAGSGPGFLCLNIAAEPPVHLPSCISSFQGNMTTADVRGGTEPHSAEECGRGNTPPLSGQRVNQGLNAPSGLAPAGMSH